MADAVLGIDLGTTNSAVATINQFGFPEIIADSAGEHTTPSALYFAPGGKIEVGREARDSLAFDPDRVALFFKRMMGDPEFVFPVDGRDYSATQLSAEVLRHLGEVATAAGIVQPKVVVTVPAYFSHVEREATIEAARLAGLTVLCTVNEPTAAAIAYGSKYPDLTGRIIVYDLGGGTFDVTLLDYSRDEMRVIATIGDHHLGGVQWDDVLIGIAKAQFYEATGIEIEDDPVACGELRLAAERAKQTLSLRDQVNIPVSSGGVRHSCIITRAEFEEGSAHLLDSTRSLLVEMLRDSGARWPEIHAVLLVGGSTRMPQVRELLTRLSGKPPLADINPDEAVALGAALRAAEGDGATRPRDLLGSGGGASRSTVDVTSHSLGYVQISADGHRYVNGTVIRRNTAVPARESRPSKLDLQPGQEGTLNVLVFQGDQERVLDNVYAGAYRVEGIPGQAGATIVDVTFGYDVSGVVVVEAVLNQTGAPLRVVQAERPADLAWTDTDPTDAPQVEPMPIMIAIDTSGSMSGTLNEAKRAAEELLKQIDLNTMPTGIAEFGMRAGVVLKPCSDEQALSSTIARLSAGNGTPMGRALAACLPEFTEGRGILVLLTDGGPDNASEAISACDALRAAGVTIYTVGVTGADASFLRQVASFPDAVFEPSASDLVGTFRGIGRDIASGGSSGLRS